MHLSIGVFNMLRHSQNSNLVIHNELGYRGLPIQIDKGPFIRQYLERLHATIDRALQQHSRVFAFRVDLRFPAAFAYGRGDYTNQVFERFVESFKARIRHNRCIARRENKHAHQSGVRYVWAREVGQHGRPHYHVAFFLNYDAFNALGKFEPGRDNMFNRLQEAWASALGSSVDEAKGLVEIPSNPTYCLRRDEPQGVVDFFYRASYLCKAATKVYGSGQHGFGSSRV